ncbi:MULTISPECIES: nuclease-related domain-containing protein [Roseiflexus]|uniref:NERD domain protein n=1 Tax=Roseiflexus castenholzii (strain DSM 13941 / HLO8) TaxID=383372 RepID=A7NQQ2_ROSCS|nr:MULTISPECIES: nuclease-related domain-containing protein [Roseiflexus]ABU59898.1 NERD domain protein [Roseiflexus castenholzii DSM 13941]GIW03368.1 MAG: nuclease [Roseiflexus sp.]
MAVQVWIGEKPEHANERRAIMALARGLDRLDGLYLILANFTVGGRSIDLVIVKQDAVFIIELKHCDGRVFGDVNGPWFVEGSNGERKRLNPGRKNPYNQVISYYYNLVNFLNDHRTELLPPQKAKTVDFRTCRRLVVIAPTLQEGSHVETDWKVDLKGLDELPAYLVTERSSEIDLTDEEMLRIPELLHLTRWTEINALLAGVLPNLDDSPAVDRPVSRESPVITGPVGSVTALAAPSAEASTPATQAQPVVASVSLSQRLSRLWQSWAGRIALASSLIVVVLIGMIFSQGRALPRSDQPAQSMVVSTSLPAGGADAGAISPVSSCIWSGFQPVGRRMINGSWENVGVGGNAPGLTPDVVVTLEEVEFCDGRITLRWSLRNNLSDQHVEMPLTAENIEVRDSVGTRYLVTDDLSQPRGLRALPGERVRGSAVIDRPVNLNASTLVVVLKKLPFGETTWLVPTPGAG